MLIEEGLRRTVITDQNISQLQVGRWSKIRHANVTGFQEEKLTANGVLAQQSVQLSAEWCATAPCSQQQTAVYNNPEFVVGTMVWTLFDCE